MSDKKLISLADSFMAIFGFKRIATIKDNVITPAKFECEISTNKPIYYFGDSTIETIKKCPTCSKETYRRIYGSFGNPYWYCGNCDGN